jgi:hypothetical protein
MRHVTRLGRLGVGVGAVTLALMSSCSSGSGDGASPADAIVSVAIDPDGDARVRLWLERFDPSTSPHAIGDVTRAAFPLATSVRIDPDPSSSQQVVAEVEDAFGIVGVFDAFTFDGGAVVAMLASSGYRVVDLEVCWPRIPSTVTSSVELHMLDHCLRWWGIDPEMSVPTFTVRFEPEPWRWWALVSLGTAGGVLALAAVREYRRRSHRGPTVGTALVALAVSSSALAVGGARGAQLHLELSRLDGTLKVTTRLICGIAVAVASASIVVALIVGALAVRAWVSNTRRGLPPPATRDLPSAIVR